MAVLDGTTHTATVSGLQNGENYTYYIKCSNASTGVKNTDDYIINFSVYDNSKPIYRFWSDTYHGHFYTISESEKNDIIANDPNWRYEGITYYVPK
jgi:hypothetical protein